MDAVESHISEYRSLSLNEVVDYDKFNHFAITAHSTQIEGSTLTVEETGLLIDEGITPKGKPLEHSMMVKDHHEALQLALHMGQKKESLSTSSICRINAQVMKHTGVIYNTALGTVDSGKGELRKGSVRVQARYFPSYDKVPTLLKAMTLEVNKRLSSDLSLREQIDLSYSVHFNLVSIHPHYDGNGRTSRLLMNQLQHRFNLPLAVVHKEDKQEYFESLEASRNEGKIEAFKRFMDSQYIKHLSSEMNLYKAHQKKHDKGLGLTMLF